MELLEESFLEFEINRDFEDLRDFLVTDWAVFVVFHAVLDTFSAEGVLTRDVAWSNHVVVTSFAFWIVFPSWDLFLFVSIAEHLYFNLIFINIL